MPAQETTQGDGITFPEEVEIESLNEVITDLVKGFGTEHDISNDIFSDLNEVGPTSWTPEVTTPRPTTLRTDIPDISTTTLPLTTVINGFVLPQYNFKKKNLANSINDNIESVR